MTFFSSTNALKLAYINFVAHSVKKKGNSYFPLDLGI